ncbi:LLM class flavin-dependent oxidoreductase [Fodinicola feengrottensis]|uniref:LLM class flavin-dependent oxidoreductase n=1 Tax=Fodinicola feengrottensis TaxID=435914 RepID=A0ABN2HVK3_9ACTN|nr:LLM class flavin-dependent oxidoreductase [Fodinicola feengrottensis]
MRYGLKVNPGTWPEATQWAGIAEDAGFHSLWTGDNLRNSRDAAIAVHDGPTLLAAWAATTVDIQIGLLIANLAYRQPAPLAKQAVTLDHISGGRFELGIGSGLWPADHAMAGVPYWPGPERADRLAEFVGSVDRLLGGDTSDHSGAYYSYRDAAMSPGPVQDRIPLLVAANGPRALAVAATYGDAWVTFTGAATEEEFYQASVERADKLDQLCTDANRDPASVRRILLAYGSVNPWASPDALAQITERYQAIGFTEIVCYAPKPAERPIFDKAVGTLFP